MRDCLYWTIKRERYMSNFSVFRVTRVRSDRIYGSIGAISTHAKPRDCYGRFDTEEQAFEACTVVRAAYMTFDDDLRQAKRAVEYLHQKQEEAVVAALDKLRSSTVWSPIQSETNHASV